MKKPLMIHPFLFAAYPILFLFAANMGELTWRTLVTPLAISICFSLLAWFFLRVVLKNSQKSGAIVSLFLLLFFSYGHFAGVIKGIQIIWPTLFLGGIYLSLRVKREYAKLTYILNAIAAVLVVFSLIKIGVYQVRTGGGPQITGSTTIAQKPSRALRKSNDLPNIFFIILDAYARADVLEEIYGYDNGEFLNFLTQKGFYVAQRSRSNYSLSHLTVASSLNMRYLNDLVGTKLDVTSNDQRPLWKMTRQSEVLQSLQQMGYRIVTFSGSISEKIVDPKKPNDYIQLSPGWTLNSFQNALINTTPIPALLEALKTSNQFDLHRKKTNYILNHLADLSKLNRPLFVYAHVEMPHPPFVFGPNGEERNPEEKFSEHDADWLIRDGRLTRDQYLRSYIDQLAYINKKSKTMISEILSNSKNPPIIILFGDHGPRSMLAWDHPEKTYMKECMSILNAYYLPNGGHAHLYEDITPVNTFRVIFNHYFGTNYEILEDESYYSTGRYNYRFFNVTDRIINSNKTIVYNNLGNDAIRQGNLEKAIHYFSEALRINASSADSRFNLGLALFKQGSYQKAIFQLKNAIDLKPENHIFRNQLGAFYLETEKLDDALVNFEEAIRIKSDYEPAHMNLGNALAQQGRLQEAIEHYTAALQIEPDFAEAHNNLGIALARLGRLMEARSHYLEALRIKPDFAEAHNNLGIALARLGRLMEARSHYLEALRIKPDYAEAYNNLGVAYARQGKFTEAITNFSEALRLDPEYVQAQRNLKLALQMANKAKETSSPDMRP
jgi:tetratricopeptide (TPR) repeat protein